MCLSLSFREWSVISYCPIGKHCARFTKSVSSVLLEMQRYLIRVKIFSFQCPYYASFRNAALTLKLLFHSVELACGFSTISFSYNISFISLVIDSFSPRTFFSRHFDQFENFWPPFAYVYVLCDGQLRLGYICTLELLLSNSSDHFHHEWMLYRSFLAPNYWQNNFDAPIGISSCYKRWSLMT